MKAHDTVMSKKQIEHRVMVQAIAAHKRGFLSKYGLEDGVVSGENIAKAQAEITWKACLKEVVAFIEKYLPDPEEYVDPEVWRSFLKEHGMEG